MEKTVKKVIWTRITICDRCGAEMVTKCDSDVQYFKNDSLSCERYDVCGTCQTDLKLLIDSFVRNHSVTIKPYRQD